MTNSAPFRTVEIETGTFAVVRTDDAKPPILEVVATFYDSERAQDYAARENALPSAPQQAGARAAAPKAAPKRAPEPAQKSAPKAAAKNAAPKKDEPGLATETTDLTDRQNAVLGALRVMMDGDKSVEAKATTLAEAAKVPLGSLHSILQSLEKRELIRNTRTGSAKAPAIYQVL